jgi:hypothetical protein
MWLLVVVAVVGLQTLEVLLVGLLAALGEHTEVF